MLSFAPDFWPLFWAILGGAALLTVALSLLVAAFSPTWFRPHHRHQAASAPAGPAGSAGRQVRHPHRGRREVKTA
jgi:hypothetical protein